LDRCSVEGSGLQNDAYHYPASAGSGVLVYVVDTGILINHQEFAGRAIWGANFADTTNTDCNGHGTHVAGTVGGRLYGIAKAVTLIAVKVLSCSGSGTLAGVIRGIQFAVTDANGRKANGNMSLGSSYSEAVNNAVAAAVGEGVCMAVASGNDGQDACNYSPASTPTAISVCATEVGPNGDNPSYFTNWGQCVHICAPGSAITSAWHTSTSATNTISGTSMASPHVCGVIALRQAHGPHSCQDIKNWVVNNADFVNTLNFNCGTSQSCQRTPKLILQNGCY